MVKIRQPGVWGKSSILKEFLFLGLILVSSAPSYAKSDPDQATSVCEESLELQSEYMGEERGLSDFFGDFKILYFSEAKALRYLVSLDSQGRFLSSRGRLLDTTKQEKPLMIVMDLTGRIFVFPLNEQGTVRHSSPSRGARVSFAGQVQFRQGVLQMLDNNSGHYHPDAAAIMRVLRYLKQHNTDLSRVQLRISFVDIEPLRAGLVDEGLLESDQLEDTLALPESLEFHHFFDPRFM